MKYAAQIEHVREVTLIATADLAFWKEHLRPRKLHPAVRDGRAELLVIAADARYMGVRFREVSVSVSISRTEGGGTRDGAFLVQAFNSVRFFAFVERVFFSTPYRHAAISLDPAPPASVRIDAGGETLLRAEMSAVPGRVPLRSGEDGWQGPVYLPTKDGGAGKQFFAKIGGVTKVFPFTEGDVLKLAPSRDHPVFEMLLASGFAGCEWHLRADARHGKGKTVARGN